MDGACAYSLCVGDMYQEGTGINKNVDEAFKCYKSAVELGTSIDYCYIYNLVSLIIKTELFLEHENLIMVLFINRRQFCSSLTG